MAQSCRGLWRCTVATWGVIITHTPVLGEAALEVIAFPYHQCAVLINHEFLFYFCLCSIIHVYTCLEKRMVYPCVHKLQAPSITPDKATCQISQCNPRWTSKPAFFLKHGLLALVSHNSNSVPMEQEFSFFRPSKGICRGLNAPRASRFPRILCGCCPNSMRPHH
jgi:hypothetical protein